MKYLIVIEKARNGFSAYSPDLPGCVAAAKTRLGVERLMKSAISIHLEGLRAERRRIPVPRSSASYWEAPTKRIGGSARARSRRA